MLLSRLLELGKSGDFDDALRLGQGWRASVNAVLAKKELIWRKVVRHAERGAAAIDQGAGEI